MTPPALSDAQVTAAWARWEADGLLDELEGLDLTDEAHATIYDAVVAMLIRIASDKNHAAPPRVGEVDR